ncbi:MFS transporter [Actinocorallia sp. API 0066]|uniref:MFS transporter n=1 Tax=Actinocorallia sp. API 0066 TaxID=2896846 RepID=UPI001E639096|nr:MFS transporter [Actinocorallia sp. API 0066]MCD0449883.1 MFS transporter [Actinocorallia sp. API 0066]
MTPLTTRQRTVLIVLLGVQFMLAIDFSILNVAMPVIGSGLGFRLDDLQWIATAFALPAAGLTLLSGRVADLLGRRRVFLAGMVLLAVGSLIGGFAQNPGTLLAGRVVQGVSAAVATPAALALLMVTFPEGPLRNRALGLNGALMSAGFTAGALFGGILTDALSWRWAFLVNVPIAVAVLVLGPLLLPESRDPQRPRLDVPGALTVSLGLLALIYGITVERWAIAVGVVLLAAFALIERRAAAPLASPRVLGRPTVRWGNAGGLLVFAMESSVIFLLTIYLQEVLDLSAFATGLVFGVTGAGAFLGGIVAPRLIARVGLTGGLVTGLALQGAFALALVTLGDTRTTGLVLTLVFATLGAFGHALGIVAFFGTATSGVPDSDQGLATGLATMTQQVSLTAGIPIMSAIATASASMLTGLHTAFVVNGLITLIGASVIAVALGVRKDQKGKKDVSTVSA